MYYLAYGSNLHPKRLRLRVSSAMLIGAIELPRYSLTFHKASTDGSAKCNLLYAEQSESIAYGVVYEIDDSQVPILDQVEGEGSGYIKQQISLASAGLPAAALVYLADHSHLSNSLRPYDWYRGFVEEGARYHGFPAAYIGEISATPCIMDKDPVRSARERKLLVALQQDRPTEATKWL